jgi:uncharacterized membrane protein YkoI
MSPTTRKILIAAALTAVFAGMGAGISVAQDAGSGDDGDVPLSGTSLDRASEAALEQAGGGEVVDSEVEDEGGYEIEVNLDDGRQIEVQLDANYAVMSSDENEEGDDGDGD